MRSFEVVKLRTMVENAEHLGAGIYYDDGDSRITRAGSFARLLSLDELPQLWNVLRGEMSIVGPRPMLPVIVEQYRDAYERILVVKPGITGLCQVSGRSELNRSRRLELDTEYAEGWTFVLDAKILFKTVGVLLRDRGEATAGTPDEVER